MSYANSISELLLRWEELREQGTSLTPEELCRDAPELIPDVKAQIQAILSMDAMLKSTPRPNAQSDTGRPDATVASPVNRTSGKPVTTQSNYRVLRPHARGGLGEVLIAKDESLGREVALKVMQPAAGSDPERCRRFVNEAAITSLLEHPGVVPIYGVGQDEAGRPCYTMRFIQGETLRDAVRQFHETESTAAESDKRGLVFRGLIARFITVCNTLAYAHSRGVIHRDLKPANIMLGKFGETLVVDWGLAKRIQPNATATATDASEITIDSADAFRREASSDDKFAETQTGQALGTPAYMSPEQAAGDWNSVGPASDIYGLGATLYMMLTGRAPVEGTQLLELLDKVQRGEFPRPRRLRPEIPQPLEAICLKSMSLDSAQRYASATRMATDLEHWLAGEPVTAWVEPLTARAQRWLRRHRLIVTTAAVAGFVALIGLTAVLVVTSNSNRDLRLSNERERTAKLDAQRNEQVAQQQSELALATLQSVTNDIQKQLKNMPAAHPARRSLLLTALDGLDKVAAGLNARVKVDRSAAFAHRELGDIYLQAGSVDGRGGTAAAEREFRKALEICLALDAGTPNDSEIRAELAVCYDKVGDLLLKAGSTKSAQGNYEQAVAIRASLLRVNPDDAAVRRSLSVSCIKLGDGHRRLGDLTSARANYEKAVTAREQAIARAPQDRQSRRDLEIALNKLGDVCRQMGSPQEGLDLYLRALDISRLRSRDDPNDAQAERDLAFSLGRVADAHWESGRLDLAYEFHRDRMKISQRRVAADPRNEEAQSDLAVGHERLGDLKVLSGSFADAMPHFDSNLGIWKTLIASDPANATAQLGLAVTWEKIGGVHRSLQNFERARESFSEALKIKENLASTDGGSTRAQSALALTLQRLGDVEFELSHPQEARARYVRLLELAEKLAATDSADPNFQALLAIGRMRMGNMEQLAMQPKLALVQFERALAILRQLESSGTLPHDHNREISKAETAIAECKTLMKPR
jgi:serine/threonine-protein kinase